MQGDAFIRARRRVLQWVMARTADSVSVAGELELVGSHGLPRTYHDQLAQRVAQLTLSRFRPWFTSTLALDAAVVVASGPRDTVAAMYRAAGIRDHRELK